MAEQREGSYWANPDSCYLPKFVATVWHLQLLAELGMDGSERRIRNSCERFLKQHAMSDGGYACGMRSGRYSEECLTGRMPAVLLQFGYSPQDPRIRNALNWLLDHQLEDGGWNCHHGPMVRHSSIYSTFMALWAFSKIPANRRSPKLKRAIKGGVEFMLAHRLYKSHRTGKIIGRDWTKFHFPLNVRYDVLHSLKLLTDLGVASDKRLNDALDLVESKMQPDGRWLLDVVPERKLDKTGRSAIRLEEEGKPSKWITLNALTVLSRTNRIRIPRT